MVKIDKIKAELNDLIKMYNTCSNKEEKLKIHFTISQLFELLDEVQPFYDIKGYDRYKNSKTINLYVDSIISSSLSQTYEEDYQNLISKIIDNSKDSIKITENQKDIKNTLFSIEEVKTLLMDFFKQFDKNLLPFIKKCLDDENLFIKFDCIDECTGFHTFNAYTGSSYIFVNKKCLNIDTMEIIAHELGHAINAKLNYKFGETNFSNLVEVPSCTIAMLFLMYLKENNIVPKETELCINKQLQTLFFCISRLRRSIKISLEDINLYTQWKYDALKNLKYSLGHLVSIYYKYQYKTDPEKTRYDLYDFINHIGLENDLHMLSNYGIDKEQFESCETLKKEYERNQRCLRKIKS